MPRNAAEENQLANYTAGIYKALGEPTPPSQTQMASQTPEAQSASGSSLASAATSTDMEYDPARIKAIANYRPGIPEKISADGKTSSGDTYNIDNSKKSASSGSSSGGTVASVWNEPLIFLLDRTISDKMA